ncbi:hypothetical protein HJFPF1_09441 [Paramyrothecium foliicola]|nr:hypothetical protein HJFPF1_09441 [Paramyrothecium foliicola]
MPVKTLLAYLGFCENAPSWSWHDGNPSPYSWDLGLWDASKESRGALLWYFKHTSTRHHRADDNCFLPTRDKRDEVDLRVRPTSDIFCLQLEELNKNQARGLDWAEVLRSLPFWPTSFSPATIAFEFDSDWCKGMPRDFDKIRDENSTRGLIVRAFVASARGELGSTKIWIIDRGLRPSLTASPPQPAVYADLDYQYVEVCASLSGRRPSALYFCDWIWAWYWAHSLVLGYGRRPTGNHNVTRSWRQFNNELRSANA